MAAVVHCPGAVASEAERLAYVNGEPRLRQSSLDFLPASPIAKATRVEAASPAY